jgi:hypothetical protein
MVRDEPGATGTWLFEGVERVTPPGAMSVSDGVSDGVIAALFSAFEERDSAKTFRQFFAATRR